jgi:hypothetical protein
MRKIILTLIISLQVLTSFSQEERIVTNKSPNGKSDFIYKNGNVGIGTNTPIFKFDLSGNTNTTKTISISQYSKNTSSGSRHLIRSDSNGLSIINDIGTGNSEQCIHLGHWDTSQKEVEYGFTYKDGNVGIGTNTPIFKFDLSGNTNTTKTISISQYSKNTSSGSRHLIRSDSNGLSIINDIGTGNSEQCIHLGHWNTSQKRVEYGFTYRDGNVGIGTNNTKEFKLAVKGKIGAEEIQINAPGYWPDYVFTSNYKLKPLNEVEAFIKQNNHLPEIPSEREIKEKGINLADMDAKLLQKIEELTLYMIEQNKETKFLKKENMELRKEIEELKKLIK